MNTLEQDWQDILDWFGVAESKVAAFLKPIISDVVSAGKADLLSDVVVDAPAIAASFATGGVVGALATAETSITTQLSAQGTQLAQTTMAALAASAVASAQAALAVTSAPATASSAPAS